MPNQYRKNAGIVVFNCKHQVLLCKRNDVAESWQFPQGGIEQGETIGEAALRELKEETSLVNVKLIKSLDTPARYTFPPKIIRKMQAHGYKNIGQDIYWSFVYFDGNDTQINLQTAKPEFSDFRWDTMENACRLAVDFKKEAYQVAQKAFFQIAANWEKAVIDHKKQNNSD